MKTANDILKRVADLLERDPTGTPTALALASVKAHAKSYPPKLTAAARNTIKANYPDATDDLIAERAMSDYGTSLSITSSIVAAQIAMDYSPMSYMEDQLTADQALPDENMDAAQAAVGRTYKEIRELGLTPFGAASMMIALASEMACEQGLSVYQLLRPLLETALDGVSTERTPQMQKDIDEAKLDLVSSCMNISRDQAKKYLKS